MSELSVENLVLTGSDFSRYDICDTGSTVIATFDDQYDVCEAYGNESVYEWAAHAVNAGYATDCLEIHIDKW